MEKLKQRCSVVSFTGGFQCEASRTVLCAMKALDRGSRHRKERIAVVEA